MNRRRTGPWLAIATLVGSALLAAACSAAPRDARTEPGSASGGDARVGLPSSHVHGVARDPGDGALLLATHEGLFRYGTDGPKRVSPIIDLMGFTIAGADHYYASGHPNVVMELPQPMGLIESTDGGSSWKVLSRGGESDFHALARAGDTVVAFDGQLRRSPDGRSWQTSSIPAEPRSLASDPTGTRILATTPAGLLISTDKGATWTPSDGGPLLLLVSWADKQTAVGIGPGGAVAISRDAAKTWRTTGTTEQAPQAMSARLTRAGLEILVVTENRVLTSKDGARFTEATT
ncbi:exo-alpha-sialidase [Knoellia sp. DB2414S]|uniref:Exo-alpha-sialidase n=1 Tax=Knoellia koreensis TaxID=2730921 RepID=A0A849HTD4_9MICO|nr:exo-alpha-sialidase [Knoellia sp. DB2414S]